MRLSSMLTETDLLQALRDCYDPHLACNIVDLGLLHSLSITPDPDAPGATIPGVPLKHRVALTLTPTTPDPTAHAQLSAQITNRLAGLPTVSHTVINLLDEPLWTPLRITPAGRRILGLDGNPSLVQIR